jgi:hypothetical protein
MNANPDARARALSAILFLFTACPMLAQMPATQRLAEAFALEKEGKFAPAFVELRALLDSNSLDTLRSGKAWNILGLAYEDWQNLRSHNTPMKSRWAFCRLAGKNSGPCDGVGRFWRTLRGHRPI